MGAHLALQQLIRSMGAYFVRRNSNNPIYRRVLERYVHMATEAGVAQAMYPEGGLSRDGRLREPKLGLFDYMLKSFDPKAGHDIVFVPVALNYDRVLEDRTLLRSLDKELPRRGALFAARTCVGFWFSQLGLMLRGRWYRFGYACVNFGGLISPATGSPAMRPASGGDLRILDKDQRFEVIGRLAKDVMGEIARLVPVLPVSVIATVLLEAKEPLDELELKVRAADLMAHFEGPRRQALSAARRPRLRLRCRDCACWSCAIWSRSRKKACSRRWPANGPCSPTTPTPSPICADDASVHAAAHALEHRLLGGPGLLQQPALDFGAAMAFYTMFAIGPIMIFSITSPNRSSDG
jgi:glycerol-3-phosphate O-acyltransferase